MLIVNLLGALLIGFIVWWFWLYRPAAATSTGGMVSVTVADGVYSPARIKLPANTPVAIQFLRKDASPCAAMVQFPDLEISEELEVGKSVSVQLPALEKGEYAFSCQMQMYRGTLIIE